MWYAIFLVKCKYLFSVSAKLKCIEFSTKENCKIKLKQKIVFCGILDRFPCLLESRGIVLYKISRTWKVLVNEFDVLEILVQGPGKSQNLLGNDADTDTKICSVHTPLFCVQTVFFAFHRSMYQWWTYTPVLEFFVTERVGTPFTDLYPFICFTHTHPFNGPLSRTTWVSRFQKGKNQSGFYWSKRQRVAVAYKHQLGHMQVCTLLQTDNHASTPPLSFFTGRMPFLPSNQQRQSTEGIVFILLSVLINSLFAMYII